MKRGAGKALPSLYQLNVVLIGAKPAIWRRLQVPGHANLGWLHAVLQVAMGWSNSHLHQFRAGEHSYSDPRHHFAEFEGDPEILDERHFTLEQIAPQMGNIFTYDYDFGDSWEHEITVEMIQPQNTAPVAVVAHCAGGAGACPPEDCGGIWGYADLLKILKNRKHPEHEEMKEWLGRPFDSKAFDAAKTNTWLRILKWPQVSESQLRRVLMGRENLTGWAKSPP
jgi:hypothetical protein